MELTNNPQILKSIIWEMASKMYDYELNNKPTKEVEFDEAGNYRDECQWIESKIKSYLDEVTKNIVDLKLPEEKDNLLKKVFYNLGIGERENIDGDIITRVPGGWVLLITTPKNDTSVFIPYLSESDSSIQDECKF